MLATVESPLAIASVVLDLPLDARAFLFTAVAATGAGLLAALVPALQATRPGLLRDLNGALPIAIRSALGAPHRRLLRHVLATGGWVVAVGLGSRAVLALVVHRVAARVAAGVLAADAVVWTGVLLLLVAV